MVILSNCHKWKQCIRNLPGHSFKRVTMFNVSLLNSTYYSGYPLIAVLICTDRKRLYAVPAWHANQLINWLSNYSDQVIKSITSLRYNWSWNETVWRFPPMERPLSPSIFVPNPPCPKKTFKSTWATINTTIISIFNSIYFMKLRMFTFNGNSTLEFHDIYINAFQWLHMSINCQMMLPFQILMSGIKQKHIFQPR